MIWETYSQRIKKEVEGLKDVYTYDNIPDKLRVQIMHIWDEVIAEDEEVWENIHLSCQFKSDNYSSQTKQLEGVNLIQLLFS